MKGWQLQRNIENITIKHNTKLIGIVNLKKEYIHIFIPFLYCLNKYMVEKVF